MRTDTRIFVRVTPDAKARAFRIAGVHGLSLSQFIRDAVTQACNRYMMEQSRVKRRRRRRGRDGEPIVVLSGDYHDEIIPLADDD